MLRHHTQYLSANCSKKSSFSLFPLLLSCTHTWPLDQEPFWTRQQLTVRFPFYHKVPPMLTRFELCEKNQLANKRQALIYTALVLSKPWKYHYISDLQNPDLASLHKGFRRRCTATQLQIGFLVTSTGRLAKGEKQLIRVFSQLSLTCPLHTGKRLQN